MANENPYHNPNNIYYNGLVLYLLSTCNNYMVDLDKAKETIETVIRQTAGKHDCLCEIHLRNHTNNYCTKEEKITEQEIKISQIKHYIKILENDPIEPIIKPCLDKRENCPCGVLRNKPEIKLDLEAKELGRKHQELKNRL
jgi:hypothetical protein